MPKHNPRDPDQQLLLDCARASSLPPDHTRTLLQNVSNWDSLADAAAYHGLAPTLYRTLETAAAELVPPTLLTRLRDDDRDSARRNLILTSQFLALLDAFQAEGISVLPLKGPVLAESLYPDPLLRPFSDLDILVRPKDVAAAIRALTSQGYTLKPHLAHLSLRTLMRLDFQLLFYHPHKVAVDIQWDTAPADFPSRFDPELLWRAHGSIDIAGRPVPTLSRESLLLFLCVHGAKHLWSRLQWLGDIARLANAPLDWHLAARLTAEAKCERPFLLGLLLAHDLLDAPVPPPILERARTQPSIVARAQKVTLRLMCIPPIEPRGAEFTSFNARLAERTRDRLRHYAALLKAPTDKELEILTLPESLFFLYYPLRAARLALKYVQRLAGR